jgi:hypothetical protein
MSSTSPRSYRLDWKAGLKHLQDEGIPEDRAKVMIKGLRLILDIGELQVEAAKIGYDTADGAFADASLDSWKEAVERLEKNYPGLPGAVGLTPDGKIPHRNGR